MNSIYSIYLSNINYGRRFSARDEINPRCYSFLIAV